MLRSRLLRGLVRLRYRLSHQFVLIVACLVLLMGGRSLHTSNFILEPVHEAEFTYRTVHTEPAAVPEEEPTTETPTKPATRASELCKFKPVVSLSRNTGRGQTALVTGVAGFVGSHVASYLVNQLGLTVIGVDDLSSGKSKNIPEGVQFLRGSVVDSKLLHRLFVSYKFDHVYHLAGHAGEQISHHLRSFTYTNELVASANLLNAVVRAGGTRRFVYLSTSSVYSDSARSDDSPAVVHTEDSSTGPMSPVAIAKLAFENDLQAAQRSFGLSYVILRAHNLYGPGQNLQDPYHSVVSSFIRQHLNQRRSQPVTIYGDGMHLRAFTYINDVVPLIGMSAFLPATENEIINIGTDELVTINAVKDMVGDALGRPRPATYVKSHAEAREIRVDHTKMRCTFGARPMTSLRDGLAQLIPVVMAGFSGKENIQSVLRAKQMQHVELAEGMAVQSWEGHEVDVVNEMRVSEESENSQAAGGNEWPGARSNVNI